MELLSLKLSFICVNVFSSNRGVLEKLWEKDSKTVFLNLSRSTVFNGTYREKLFYSIQHKNGCLAVCDLFTMLTHSTNVLHITLLHMKEWPLLSASFTAKLEFVFVLILENAFSWRFLFKANRKSIGFSKIRL